MNTKVTSPVPEPTEAEIQHVAYLLWLEGGEQPDRDLEYWFAAKELLRHRHAPASGHKKGKVSPIPPSVPVTPANSAQR